MSSQIIVSNLGKKYKRYANRWTRLIEWVTFGRYQNHRATWILRNLNFELGKGDSLGIIGVNGAGKSTLLKLLTQTSVPTEGNVEIQGRVSALLELGMGFHHDFSGRVNAMMTCQMMGYTHEESEELIQKIRDFSELGDYLEQPVRVYSTGMQVRLAFSAATVTRPDILIVDEALSVGDAYFQHKCISRIREYRDKGTTLLFVSHDPGAVKSLCKRAILLDKGTIVKDGVPDSVLDYYNSVIARKRSDENIEQVTGDDGKVSTRSGNGKAKITSVDMTHDGGKTARTFLVGEDVTLHCTVKFIHNIKKPVVGILLRDRLGNDVYGTNTSYLEPKEIEVVLGESLEFSFSFPLNIGAGNYSISAAVHGGDTHLEDNCDWWDRCLSIQVVPGRDPSFVGVVLLPVQLEISTV